MSKKRKKYKLFINNMRKDYEQTVQTYKSELFAHFAFVLWCFVADKVEMWRGDKLQQRYVKFVRKEDE